MTRRKPIKGSATEETKKNKKKTATHRELPYWQSVIRSIRVRSISITGRLKIVEP